MEVTMKLKNRNKTDQNLRRKGALERLQAQLKAGTKPALVHIDEKNGGSVWDDVPLTEGDKKRINKEITTLKTRVS